MKWLSQRDYVLQQEIVQGQRQEAWGTDDKDNNAVLLNKEPVLGAFHTKEHLTHE